MAKTGQNLFEPKVEKIKLKSLIMAQIERWRHALNMQVERESSFGSE